MLPGTTPTDPADTGAADPILAAALSSGDGASIRLAMLTARLLVPVVALPADGAAEMAVPALVSAAGRRALPVFSSDAALQAWAAQTRQPGARPVPMQGARVLLAAADEGYDGVVLDVAGSASHTVSGDDLAILAAAARGVLADPSASVVVVGGSG